MRLSEAVERSSITDWLLVLFTAVLSAVAIYQYFAMRATIGVTRQSSERNERAWVTIHDAGPLQALKGKEVILPLRIDNIGNTPARHILVDTWIEISPIDKTPDLSDTGIRYQSEVGQLVPKDSLPFFAIRQRETTPRSHNTEPWPLGSDEYDDFMAGRKYIVIHAKAYYRDVFHVKHWTKFCVWHTLSKGSVPAADCSAYNNSDDNDEP